MKEVSPINRISLSSDGNWVEAWNNGAKVQTWNIASSGGKDAAVAAAQAYFENTTGYSASVGRELKAIKLNRKNTKTPSVDRGDDGKWYVIDDAGNRTDGPFDSYKEAEHVAGGLAPDWKSKSKYGVDVVVAEYHGEWYLYEPTNAGKNPQYALEGPFNSQEQAQAAVAVAKAPQSHDMRDTMRVAHSAITKIGYGLGSPKEGSRAGEMVYDTPDPEDAQMIAQQIPSALAGWGITGSGRAEGRKLIVTVEMRSRDKSLSTGQRVSVLGHGDGTVVGKSLFGTCCSVAYDSGNTVQDVAVELITPCRKAFDVGMSAGLQGHAKRVNPFVGVGEHHKSIDKASDDCVSAKIAKLVGEGYEQDQAAAIAYSMCGEKSKSVAQLKADWDDGWQRGSDQLSKQQRNDELSGVVSK